MRHFPETIAVTPPPFSMERVTEYGVITNDLNPLHVDAEFAATTRFGKPIVHGLFVLAPVWEAFERVFGASGMAGAQIDIRFVSPTFVASTPVYSTHLQAVDAEAARYAVAVADTTGAIGVEAIITFPVLAG